MKLAASVVSMKNAIDMITSQPGFQTWYDGICEQSKEKCSDPNNPWTCIRWAIWHALPQDTRRFILLESDTTFVGGYATDVNDKHINTLLVKVLPVTRLVKFMTHKIKPRENV
ncbi:hypothetical protein NVP1081O_239 [Vibrio phage 1.081.O._10N.286.52.C2]|nr:hypothetical protein NVP1081O_239 [Vibrio phage 1.081.O._10N.286.52.C2]